MDFQLGQKKVRAISDGGLNLLPGESSSNSHPFLCMEVAFFLLFNLPMLVSCLCLFHSPFSSTLFWRHSFSSLIRSRPNDKNITNVSASQQITNTPPKSTLKCSEWSVTQIYTSIIWPIIRRYSYSSGFFSRGPPADFRVHGIMIGVCSTSASCDFLYLPSQIAQFLFEIDQRGGNPICKSTFTPQSYPSTLHAVSNA